MTLPVTHSFEVAGKTFTLRVPPLVETRKRADIIHRIAPMIAQLTTEPETRDIGATYGMATAGVLTAAEIDDLTLLFAPYCECDPDGNGERILYLKNAPARDELWAQGMDEQYEWLDQCIEFVFTGVIKKAKSVVERGRAKALETARKLKEESTSPSA